MPESDPSEGERSGPPRQPPLKPYREIFAQEIYQAEEELKRPTVALAMSGLAAGLGIGVSAVERASATDGCYVLAASVALSRG